MTALAAKRRRILMTGGTSGIGLELIRRWADRHDIVTTGRSLSDDLAALLETRPGLTHAAADQANPMEAAERIDELSAYYLGDDWPEDREHMRELNGMETPAVLSEDVTWRAIADNETGIRHLVYTCAHQLVNQANGKLGDLVADAVRAAD